MIDGDHVGWLSWIGLNRESLTVPIEVGITCFLTLAMLKLLCTTVLPNFYPIYLQHSSYKHMLLIRVGNVVGPDQMALSIAS